MDSRLSRLIYTAAAGETNRVQIIELDEERRIILDLGVVITADGDCTAAGSIAICSMDVHSRAISLGDRSDTFETNAGNVIVSAGPGNDTIRTADGRDFVDGGAGSDVLDAGGGDDEFFAGNGIDGTDVFTGGSGVDIVDFSGRGGSVQLSLDDQANDGYLGEGDNLRSDVEQLLSGDGNDTLEGSSADNLFNGGPGTDQFSGLGGEDLVSYLGRYPEVITADLNGEADDGAPGENDWIRADIEGLEGGDWKSVLVGNDEPNLLKGGLGGAVLEGLGGDDRLEGGPFRCCFPGDTYRGGTGADEYVVTHEAGGFPDIIDYSDRTAGVSVDPTGSGDDGEPGEGDTLTVTRGFLEIYGGTGDDVLTAGEASVTLVGNGGSDNLTGGERSDRLYGSDGADFLFGNGERDELDGGSGADELSCGDGIDSFVLDSFGFTDLINSDCENGVQ